MTGKGGGKEVNNNKMDLSSLISLERTVVAAGL
jgi:hypothetical protein